MFTPYAQLFKRYSPGILTTFADHNEGRKSVQAKMWERNKTEITILHE